MIIGLTGGIGSGKSTVAKLFEVLGVPVYNSDARAKEMYYKPEVKKQVIALFGTEAYNSNGKLNPTHVAKIIFNDSSLLQKINDLIHPEVEKDFEEFHKNNSAHKIVIMESALLFETGIYKKIDKTILITSADELRIARVTARDGITAEEVAKRIKHQWSDEEKIPISDFVIKNDEVEGLIPQVNAVFEKLKNV
ncbi:MAG TPA: dephospho-CoA kinase [Bacteroidia bacterium]|jgi:dephospho-CoA kinase|nr:dephospho-CoA kinase [Bacteroidia bacterium]